MPRPPAPQPAPHLALLLGDDLSRALGNGAPRGGLAGGHLGGSRSGAGRGAHGPAAAAPPRPAADARAALQDGGPAAAPVLSAAWQSGELGALPRRRRARF